MEVPRAQESQGTAKPLLARTAWIISAITRFSCFEFRDTVMEACDGLHNFRMHLLCKEYTKNQGNH